MSEQIVFVIHNSQFNNVACLFFVAAIPISEELEDLRTSLLVKAVLTRVLSFTRSFTLSEDGTSRADQIVTNSFVSTSTTSNQVKSIVTSIIM